METLTSETVATGQARSKQRVKPPRPIKPSTTPSTESDKLMVADTYIGPTKKKGRPRATVDGKAMTTSNAVPSGSGSAPSSQPKEVIVIDGSDSDGAGPTPTAANFSASEKRPQQSHYKRSASQKTVGSLFTREPLVRRATNPEPLAPATVPPPPPPPPVTTTIVKTEPQEDPNLLGGILSYLSTASAEPMAQNAAILAALNTIDSSGKSDENAPNPALIAALRQLLTAYAAAPASNASTSIPSAPAPALPNAEPPKTHHRSSSSSQDDSIVVLDKENVNPAAFQKKSEKDYQALKSCGSMSAIPSSSSSGSSQPERPVQSLGPSARSNSNPTLRPSLTDSSVGSSSDKTVRKRTLSDFMDERENKNKGKGKERERTEKRDTHRHTSFQRPLLPQRPTPSLDSLRHYPRLLASNLPRTEPASNNYYRLPLESMAMTSPARPRPDYENRPLIGENTISESSSSGSRKSSSTSPRGSKVSASSPVRGPQNEARKKYVVPEWARTNTSTQPRLSEEAQKALEEAEERKKQERRAARKRLPSMQAKAKGKETGKADIQTGQQVKPLAPPPPPAPKAGNASDGAITVNDRPMVAAVDITFPFVTSSRPSSPPPQPTIIAKTPKTPSRDRHHPRPTPGAEDDSLFTPVMGSGSVFGSAQSHARKTPLPPPSILTSPLGNRKKARLTPTRSMLTGKTFSVPSAWTSSSSAPSSDSKTDDGETTPKKSLDKELQDALEDLDCPPTSLPIASSDIDVEEGHAEPTQEGEEMVDDEELVIVKQHWPGLPPSSPPPPSSPMLLPDVGDNDIQDDDDHDMVELPIATSDSETDTEMNEMTGTETDNFTSPDEFQSPIDGQDDYQDFFMQQDFATASEFPNSTELFETYTNINDDPDMFTNVEGLDLMDPNLSDFLQLQNGLGAQEFTAEFWEAFQPLVNHSLQVPQGAGFDMGQDGMGMTSFGEVDHAKLADDVHSLFSGCLM